MAKIVLGKRPESFKHVIEFPLHDGTKGMMEVQYKYRTMTEFGAFLDEWVRDRKAEIKAETDSNEAARKKAQEAGEDYAVPELTNEDLRKTEIAANADYIMKIVVGWNLDVEFGREAVLQLCDELPAGAAAIVDRYRVALTEGRLGN